MGLDYDFDHEGERDEAQKFAVGCLSGVALLILLALAAFLIWVVVRS